MSAISSIRDLLAVSVIDRPELGLLLTKTAYKNIMLKQYSLPNFVSPLHSHGPMGYEMKRRFLEQAKAIIKGRDPTTKLLDFEHIHFCLNIR